MNRSLHYSYGMSRDSQSGLAPARFPVSLPSRREVDETLGTTEEIIGFDRAHGYDVDAVLAASAEFRRTVPGAGAFPFMSRGEATHIAQALRAVAPDFSRASEPAQSRTVGEDARVSPPRLNPDGSAREGRLFDAAA